MRALVQQDNSSDGPVQDLHYIEVDIQVQGQRLLQSSPRILQSTPVALVAVAAGPVFIFASRTRRMHESLKASMQQRCSRWLSPALANHA